MRVKRKAGLGDLLSTALAGILSGAAGLLVLVGIAALSGLFTSYLWNWLLIGPEALLGPTLADYPLRAMTWQEGWGLMVLLGMVGRSLFKSS